VYFERDGARASTIDIVGNGFALLTSGGRVWLDAANELAEKYSIAAHNIDEAEFKSAYGVDESGAVLVRPDGYVGWRSRLAPRDPGAALREAMTSITGLRN
jgi:putative polyketide hydroxylase